MSRGISLWPFYFDACVFFFKKNFNAICARNFRILFVRVDDFFNKNDCLSRSFLVKVLNLLKHFFIARMDVQFLKKNFESWLYWIWWIRKWRQVDVVVHVNVACIVTIDWSFSSSFSSTTGGIENQNFCVYCHQCMECY